MKLLFIEDDSRSIAQVKRKVEEDHPDIECLVMDFAEAQEGIISQFPDIVSLDLLSGGLTGELVIAGQKIFEISTVRS